MSHTPGDWSFNLWGDHEIEIFAGNRIICDMAQVYDDQGQGTYTNIEDDARLIVAAPKLLAALEALVNDADDTGCDGCFVVSAELIQAAQSAIDAAIDETEGAK